MTNPPPEQPAPRRVRRDVQRNLDILLMAAAEVFESDGVDAPVRRITARAGVGAGTLYRHFPQRADLIAAVFHREVDICTEAGATLSARHEPVEALTRWLHRVAQFIAAKQGFKAALHSDEPTYGSLSTYFMQRFLPVTQELLDAAAATGRIGRDITADDLLRTVANVATPGGDAYTQRTIALLVDGLRYRSGAMQGRSAAGGDD